jgi:hypothetical protein
MGRRIRRLTFKGQLIRLIGWLVRKLAMAQAWLIVRDGKP